MKSGGEAIKAWRSYGEALWQWQRHIGLKALDALLPPRCPVSDKILAQQGGLAPDVWESLHHLGPPWCERCGWPFEQVQPEGTLCAACAAPSKGAGRLTGTGGLHRIRTALAYSEEIAPAILALKYADRTDGIQSFAQMMCRVGEELLKGPEALLIPIPLHAARLRQRRYNQAGLLAQSVAHQSGVEVRHDVLRRTKSTPPQKGGSRQARFRNVAGAFSVVSPERVKGRNVILVDDVLTTGATLLTAARPLKVAGALSVSALTLARVIKTGQSALYTLDDETSAPRETL